MGHRLFLAMGFVLLPAAHGVAGAAPASPAAASISDADISEADCRVMTENAGGIVIVAAPGLHVLRQAAAEGPFRPSLPVHAKAILCTRSSIIPAEHDDEVLALGLTLFLREAKAKGRLAVLEIVNGRFQLRFIEGALSPREAPMLQARINLFQDRSQRGR